jgi:mannose-6-phosphate isomerase-like protein (cupin superfamily)
MKEAKVVKECEARLFMEGLEICHEYIVSGKITFGSSTLMPGQTGEVDLGHPDSHEVFYVSRGEVLMHTSNNKKSYQLKEGDIIFIPEGVPHQLTNIGTQVAVITWSCAPSVI